MVERETVADRGKADMSEIERRAVENGIKRRLVGAEFCPEG